MLPIDTLKGDVCAQYPDNHISTRIDHKSTRGTESIGLFRKDLRKIEQEANLQGEFGFVTFGFKGTPRVYAALPLIALLKLLENAPPVLVTDLTGFADTTETAQNSYRTSERSARSSPWLFSPPACPACPTRHVRMLFVTESNRLKVLAGKIGARWPHS